MMARTKLDRLSWDSRQGWLGVEPTATTYEYTLVGDRVEQTKTVVVHSFTMGDVEDPDLYAAQPMIEWEKSEKGQWVMNNTVETPSWHRMADPYNYGYRYEIRARLQGPALTEWLLKYADHKD
jgi:hypothetical protein